MCILQCSKKFLASFNGSLLFSFSILALCNGSTACLHDSIAHTRLVSDGFLWPRLTEEALARDGSDSAGPGGPVHINALRIIETSL